MIDWINQRYGVNFKEADLTHVKNFSLAWNVFDDVVCNNSCSVASIDASFQTKNFDLKDFQFNLDYFKKRYIDAGATNRRFDNLNFRNADRRALVESVLLGNAGNVHEIVLALAIIVYRFRNNLFHGLKDIRLIHEQSQNFEQANTFIMTLITNYYP